MLIESAIDESEEEFRAYVTQLLIGIYGRMPEWITFQVGNRFEHSGTFFRQFICPAGSVSAFIQQHASKAGSMNRAVILQGTRFDKPSCSTIRYGVETEFDCQELRPIPKLPP